MRRLLLALVVIALTPNAAQARYLHMAESRAASTDWVAKWAPELRDLAVSPTITSSTIGHCWRDGTHSVGCTYIIEWASGESWRGFLCAHPYGSSVIVADALFAMRFIA